MLILQLFICCGAVDAVSDGAEETVGFSVCRGADCGALEEELSSLCGGCADSSDRLSSELSLCTEETDGTADDALSESGRRTLHDANETAKNKHNNIDIIFFILFCFKPFQTHGGADRNQCTEQCRYRKERHVKPVGCFRRLRRNDTVSTDFFGGEGEF